MADAGEVTPMSQSTLHDFSSSGAQCPKCDRSFDTENGMKTHHVQVHGGSIAGVESTCDWCGETFRHPSTEPGAYCSRGCKDQSLTERYTGDSNPNGTNRVELECPVCECAFEAPASEADRRVCCSLDCVGEWQSRTRVGEAHPNYKGAVELECEECGGEFEVTPARQDTAKYCSKECVADAFSGRDHPNLDMSGLEAHRESYNRTEVECANCGTTLHLPDFRLEQSDRHFCDKDCEAAARPTGEDAHAWKGGYEYYYGEEWDDRRKQVLERDNHECWVCGLSNDAHQVLFNQGTNVHHVQPFYDGGSNDMGNLIALCKYCHMRLE